MGQFKRRFYILGLSLLVLVIALAGLLGALDILNKPTPSTANPSDGTVTTTTTAVKPPPTTPTPSPTTTQPPDTPTPPTDITPELSLSLPDSFNLDLSKATDPGLSLKSSTPAHYPILQVTGAENTEYLKSINASFFDGANWIPDELKNFIPYNGEMVIPPGLNPAQIVTDNITVQTLVDIINGKVAIPTSLYPVSVNSSEPLLYFPDDGTFLAEEDFPEDYIFQTIHYIFDRQQMANADLEAIEEYLQLPSNITPRTRELADNITGGIESPFLMAKALEDYLKTNYTYDYGFQPAPEGTEPNDWFLFNEKSGVCTNFNSAFVVLCRAAGIPARMAGGFRIDPQEEAQTVYTDQAHAWAEVLFKQLGWYTFDATGSMNTPISPTQTEITTVNPVAAKGDEFTVAGTVWTDTAEPADGVLVEILVNKTKDAEGATLVGKGIVSQGHFEIKAIIPGETAVGQYQVIAHALKSTRYLESWSDPTVKVVSGTKITLDIPARIKAGQTITVNGLLTGKYGEKLAAQQVQITLNGNAAANPETDSEGRFTWTGKFNEPGMNVMDVTYAGSEYFLEATEEKEFRVLAPAVIDLKADGHTAGKPVVVSGRLREEITGDPLAGRALVTLIDGKEADVNTASNNKGDFKFSYTFEQAGSHRIEVQFAGDTDYFPVSAALPLDITIAGAFPWLPLILVVLAVIAGGAAGWLIYRRTQKTPVLHIEGEETPAENLIIPQSSGTGAALAIALPQIKPPLPDVWGVGDEMNISFSLADGTNNGISAPLEVTINDETVTGVKTGKDGKAKTNKVFTAKGDYLLAARYQDPEGQRKAAAVRPVRIVDYREEIVSLFEKLVGEFRKAGIEINEEYTPRKIQYLVTNANTGIPEKALEDAINCFEETDYSLHPITRQHYETMYLAQREIEKHGTAVAT